MRPTKLPRPLPWLVEEIYRQEYRFNHEVSDAYNVLYFKVGDQWMKFTTGDDESRIETEAELPQIESFSLDDGTLFEYEYFPVRLPDLELPTELLQICEYIWTPADTHVSLGLLFRFANGLEYSYLDRQDYTEWLPGDPCQSRSDAKILPVLLPIA